MLHLCVCLTRVREASYPAAANISGYSLATKEPTACTTGHSTAPGMDAWTKKDLSWLSDLAYQWLTKCYHSIETTHQWPSTMAAARALFLNKDPDDMGNPMAMHTPLEMEEILLEDMEERGMSEDEIEAYIHEEEDKYDQQMGTNIRAERHQKKEKQKQ